MPEAEGFASQHYVYFDTPGGRAYVLTGVVLTTMQGSGEGFRHDELQFDVPVPDIPHGLRYKLLHWAPFATPNSMASDAGVPNPAWAVDGFSLRFPGTPIPFDSHLFVSCDLAVRGNAVFLLRVGYVINLHGFFEPIPGFPH